MTLDQLTERDATSPAASARAPVEAVMDLALAYVPSRALHVAALLGRSGTLFLKELAPGVERYFAALVEQHGPPVGMERIMRLVPPGTVDAAELEWLFAPPRFHLLTVGVGHIHTINAAPDGHPILVPARYALVTPDAGGTTSADELQRPDAKHG